MTYLEKLKTDDHALKSLIFDLLDASGAIFCKECPAREFCERKMSGPSAENQKHRTEILEKVKTIISRNIANALYGFFNSRNTAGDKMTLLLADSVTNIELYICYDWGYFELFGLNDEEMRDMSNFYSDKVDECEKAHNKNKKENAK